MELRLPSGEPGTLPTLLSYRSHDPLAVRIVFHTDELVPAGREADGHDLDAELSRLLPGTA
ncbi:hypothetical protein [Kitasatospora sp. NPDC001095]